MIDGVSLDQLRTFVAAVDQKSFSGAGRALGRSQSVVSQSIANLEAQFGITLFDRSGRYPQLTSEGRSLLEDARRIVRDTDLMKARARTFSQGQEAELSIVIDVMFPQARLTDALLDFIRTFPLTPLSIHVEALGAVAQLVLDGTCSLGITGTMPFPPPELVAEPLLREPLVTVAAPSSALAKVEGPVPIALLQSETQLVLSDRSKLTKGVDFGVQGKRIWRTADLGAKRAFLLAGLGWGHMPRWLVQSDIKAGLLSEITLEGPSAGIMPFQAVFCATRLPGPGGRWLIECLRSSVEQLAFCPRKILPERASEIGNRNDG